MQNFSAFLPKRETPKLIGVSLFHFWLDVITALSSLLNGYVRTTFIMVYCDDKTELSSALGLGGGTPELSLTLDLGGETPEL